MTAHRPSKAELLETEQIRAFNREVEEAMSTPPPLDFEIQFTRQDGSEFSIHVFDLLSAFHTLHMTKNIPPVDDDWWAQIDSAHPPRTFTGHQLSGWRFIAQGDDLGCPCCRSLLLFEFKKPRTELSSLENVERHVIVAAVEHLSHQGILPTLPNDWYIHLRGHYGQIHETRRFLTSTLGGVVGEF